MKRLCLLFLAAAALTVSGCGNVKRSLGLYRNAPDEFRVTTHAPLALPSDLTALPSPAPGAPRPQELATEQRAETLLLKGEAQSQARAQMGELRVEVSGAASPGEGSFLEKAKRGEASDPAIRATLAKESAEAKANQSLIDKLAASQQGADPVVNAEEEKARILANKKEGKPLQEGEVPVVDGKEKSLLKRLFE